MFSGFWWIWIPFICPILFYHFFLIKKSSKLFWQLFLSFLAMISTFSFLRRRLAKHILIQMRFAHFNTDCVALENVFTFFATSFFVRNKLRNSNDETTILNLGKGYTVREDHQWFQRESPLGKTLTLKDIYSFCGDI